MTERISLLLIGFFILISKNSYLELLIEKVIENMKGTRDYNTSNVEVRRSTAIIEEVERKIRRAISRFHMFTPIDHILLCVYPLPHGLVLADQMVKIEKEFPKSKLTLCSLNEKMLSSIVHNYDVEVIDVGERIKIDIKELERIAEEYNLPLGSLTLAFLLIKLQEIAKEIGATKIALPLNANLEGYLVFERMIYGHIPLLDMPLSAKVERRDVIRVTLPMINILNNTIKEYLKVRGIKYKEQKMPIKEYVVKWLDYFEERYPGILYSYLNNVERLMRINEEVMNVCIKCGRPTISEVCEECRVLISAKLVK